MLNEEQKEVWEALVLKGCSMLYTPPIPDTKWVWYFNEHLGFKNFSQYLAIEGTGKINLGEEKTVYGFTLKPDTPDVIKAAMLMECGYTMKKAMEAIKWRFPK